MNATRICGTYAALKKVPLCASVVKSDGPHSVISRDRLCEDIFAVS